MFQGSFKSVSIKFQGYFEGLHGCHMAGSSQPQHFFAAECIFTDFEAMITDTVSTRTSAGLMAISI